MLCVTDVTVHYGPIVALRGVSLTVERGEIVVLLGSNAAGKTTLMRSIVGLKAITAGSIKYEETAIEKLSTVERVTRRISLVPEGRGILSKMSVEENLLMGAYLRTDEKGIREDFALVFETFPVLAARRRQLAGNLSGGEQQMLAIGRSLMSKPQLMLLDEPSMGLSPLLVRRVFDVIEQIRSLGITVFFVEQNAHIALDVADRAYVLERGAIVLHGPARDVRKDETVRKAYLGDA